MEVILMETVLQLFSDTKVMAACVGLLGVLLGSAIAIVGNIVLIKLNMQKEREQKIFDIEFGRFKSIVAHCRPPLKAKVSKNMI
jgi:uncharacterized membrane protein YgaE (UPF0421/DUF939 family)